MILLPDQHVIVVATPRTGSRAIRQALHNANVPNMTITRVHHEFPHEVEAIRNIGYPYEVWTMIREPVSHLKSWISYTGRWNDALEFIKTYRGRYFFYEGGMNIYNKIVDRTFLFEDNGHQAMLDALKIEHGQIPVIGKTDSTKHGLSEKQIEVAKQRFAKDFELYEREKEKWQAMKEQSELTS